MRRFLMAAMMPGCIVLLMTSVIQAQTTGKFFIGMWESVDPDDGSAVKRSRSDNDGDGVLSLRT